MARSPADQTAMTAADTETASEVDALVASPRPTGARRRAVLGAVGAAAIVAAGAVATSLKTAVGASSSASALVSASNGAVKHRTGCENWRQILITEEANSNETSCRALCGRTAGCAHHNLQAYNSCPNKGGHEGKAPGTCYIFAKGCKEKANNCWDLHYESDPGNETWSLTRPKMGCGNWAELKIAAFADLNKHQCGLECTKNPACKRFNVQTQWKASCPGTNKVGTCYLFRAGCDELANECWDLYRNLAYTTTTAAPGATTTR